jgi:hypothetical protein
VSDEEWEILFDEARAKRDVERQRVGVQPIIIYNPSPLDSQRFSDFHSKLLTICKQFDDCRKFHKKEVKDEWDRGFEYERHLILIKNEFFKNHDIYRVGDGADNPDYDLVFISGENPDDISIIFYWSGNSSAPGENNIRIHELNIAYNEVIRNESEIHITEEKLLKYISFYLYITTKNDGDFILNSLNDYERLCDMRVFCMGMLETVEAIRKQFGNLDAPKIEQILLNNEKAWHVSFYSISFCGLFNFRDMTVTEKGEVYLNDVHKIYPSPYSDYCYTF